MVVVSVSDQHGIEAHQVAAEPGDLPRGFGPGVDQQSTVHEDRGRGPQLPAGAVVGAGLAPAERVGDAVRGSRAEEEHLHDQAGPYGFMGSG